MSKSIPFGYVKTVWKCRSYDVWGNAKDGFEVNDVTSEWTEEINCPQEKHNVGTGHEFVSAYPNDRQIRKAFGVPRVKISTDGDDMVIFVNRERDGYPLGEMHCASHESLSPVRKTAPSSSEHEELHKRGPVDSRICQGVGCPFGDA